MILKNNKLELTKNEIIEMIKNDNPERHDWSRDSLINMVNSFFVFSEKQYKWLLSKVKFITNHNSKYSKYRRKFKDIVIVK